jgi:hypothetical protein
MERPPAIKNCAALAAGHSSSRRPKGKLLHFQHDGQNTSAIQKTRPLSSPSRKNIYLSEISKL